MECTGFHDKNHYSKDCPKCILREKLTDLDMDGCDNCEYECEPSISKMLCPSDADKILAVFDGWVSPETVDGIREHYRAVIRIKVAEAVKAERDRISTEGYPEHYYPAHPKLWAETMINRDGYKSELASFLKELGERWQAITGQDEVI